MNYNINVEQVYLPQFNYPELARPIDPLDKPPSASQRDLKLLQAIHLPDIKSVRTLRQQLNPNTRPLTETEANNLEQNTQIGNLAQSIREQLKRNTINSSLIELYKELPFFEDALIEVFQHPQDDKVKEQVLDLAAETRLIFAINIYKAFSEDSVLMSNLLRRMPRKDLIDNIFSIRELSDFNGKNIALILSQRQDSEALIQDLFKLNKDKSNNCVWALISHTLAQGTKGILTIEQYSALYRTLAHTGKEKIDGLLSQVEKSFSPDIVIKFFERILRGAESNSSQYAVHHYAEFVKAKEIDPLPKLRESLVKFTNPANILATCSVLSQYGEKGREAIVNAIMEQSADQSKDPLILMTLCRADFTLYEVSKNYSVNKLKDLLHTLFVSHKALITDLRRSNKLQINSSDIGLQQGNIYRALLKQIDINTAIDWILDEASKAPDLRNNDFAKNVLKFLANFDLNKRISYAVTEDRLIALRTLLGIDIDQDSMNKAQLNYQIAC